MRRRLAPAPAARSNADAAASAAVGGWIDLASFVSSSGSGGVHTPFDGLADAIGREVYIDVAGWHLFLKDVRLAEAAGGGGGLTLAQGLAQQLGAAAAGAGRGLDAPAEVAALLDRVPVRLGGGRLTVALADVVPAGAQRELEEILARYARDL